MKRAAQAPACGPCVARDFRKDIVTKGFAILDRAIGSQSYLAGDYSVADPILFYVEFWADKTNIALPANPAAHYTRMLTRPPVQRVLREEGYNTASLGKSLRLEGRVGG